jgi:hypothetical protein
MTTKNFYVRFFIPAVVGLLMLNAAKVNAATPPPCAAGVTSTPTAPCTPPPSALKQQQIELAKAQIDDAKTQMDAKADSDLAQATANINARYLSVTDPIRLQQKERELALATAANTNAKLSNANAADVAKNSLDAINTGTDKFVPFNAAPISTISTFTPGNTNVAPQPGGGPAPSSGNNGGFTRFDSLVLGLAEACGFDRTKFNQNLDSSAKGTSRQSAELFLKCVTDRTFRDDRFTMLVDAVKATGKSVTDMNAAIQALPKTAGVNPQVVVDVEARLSQKITIVSDQMERGFQAAHDESEAVRKQAEDAGDKANASLKAARALVIKSRLPKKDKAAMGRELDCAMGLAAACATTVQ